MAISLPTYISKTIGATFTDVYLKITSLDLDNQYSKSVHISFNIFVNSQSANDNCIPVGDGNIVFQYDPTITTPLMIQAYDAILILPEFSAGINI